MPPGHSGAGWLVRPEMEYPFDKILLNPHDIDPKELPVGQGTGLETYVFGTLNPGLCRLPNGNLLMMVRIAEALSEPRTGNETQVLRYNTLTGSFDVNHYQTRDLDFADPRKYRFKNEGEIYALTSLSWLLPVELDSEGTQVIEIHYAKMILPDQAYQEYGIEDPRITLIQDTYYMTTCAVASDRHSTVLYSSKDGLNYACQGLIMDHQNKDMVIFPEQIDGLYHALTRPLGELYFKSIEADSIPGPSINIASSPDLLHWRPLEKVLVKSRKNTVLSGKVGGGTPPLRTPAGWLVLYHGVSGNGIAGNYRTVWMLLDLLNPQQVIYEELTTPILEANPGLTRDCQDLIYLQNIVFTTGIVNADNHYIVASGELDLCCRITHIPHSVFAVR